MLRGRKRSSTTCSQERGVGFCNIDQPLIGRSIKPDKRVTSPIGYFRLHGRRYDTWFSDDPGNAESRALQLSIRETRNYCRGRTASATLPKDAEVTFVIANNHFQGKAAVNALQLVNLLTKSKVKVPEPLRSHYPQLDAIASEPPKEPTLFPLPPR